MKNIFVTVGTTNFPKLVNSITMLDTIQVLRELGYCNVQIQTGQEFPKINVDPKIKNAVVYRSGSSWIVEIRNLNFTLKFDHYFENFDEQVSKADLVISHAGAGTCLEVLKLNKPLIVVINEDLMDNHQAELACELQKNGYVYSCVCTTLIDTLRKDFGALQPYPKINKQLFSNYLDRCCGFTESVK